MAQNNQFLLPSLQGVALWYAAALFPQNFPSFFENENDSRYIGLMLFTIPFCFFSIQGLIKLNGWKTKAQKVEGIAIGTAVAVILDGIAHAYWPGIYGGEANIRRSAAWILWGGGWGILSSFY
eukprot:TRINITY_DN1534_c0_g1_i2.p1 TRINITY_DN1534_c0_g1~~TRINITY_DN1534_c0_g1_i2.p1  ORF type:complete len:123 (-),score=62.38 TRINITY_DN1534_c0_g1_i2:115-483(-)